MDRFHSKYQVRDCGHTSPCWVWIAGKDRDGYGRFYYKRRSYMAHRASWEIHGGKVESYPEQELDHLCANRACVNPAHLEVVSHLENTMRGTSFSAQNAHKTECQSGHPYTQRNTYIRPDGARDCRACIRERVRAYKERRRATA